MYHPRPDSPVPVARPSRGVRSNRGGAGRQHLRPLLVVALAIALLGALGVVALVGLRASSVPVDTAASRLAAAKSAASLRRTRAGSRSTYAAPIAPSGAPPSPSAPNVTMPRPSASAPARVLPSSVGGTTATVPDAITADCGRDVTGPLNSWMASVADGSTLAFRPGACYRVDGTLVLTDRRDLTIDGRGATLAASVVPPASPKITRQMWSVVAGSDVTLENMALRGTNPTAMFDVDREWFPLIQIAGTRTVLVQGVRGSNSWGDFVSVGPDVRRVTGSGGSGAVPAEDVTIRESSASVIGRHAVMCNGCQKVLVDHNDFSDVAYQILDIEVEAASWQARDIALTDNTIGGRVKLSVLANAGIGRDVTGITVSGNTMTGTPVSCAPPIRVDATSAVKSGFVISGNRFKTLGNALWLRGVSDVTVQDNVFSVGNGGCTDSGVAVIAANGHGDVLRDNDFSGARELVSAGSSAIGAACGNRLTGTAFDQPGVCRRT